MRWSHWLRAVSVVLVVGFGTVGARTAHGGEINFIEEFALAPDRSVPLKQLVPGTEDFYYFHCLHAQQTEQFDKVEPLVTQWIQRVGHTPRVNEILARQALLTYDKNPQKTLEFLRNKLGVNFGHQKEELGVEPNLPTKLDPQWISRATLIKQALQQPSTEGFTDSAFDWLVNENLDGDRRRHLISRLARPDYAPLTKLILDDFGHPNSGGFGQFNVHRLLTQAQLDELLKQKPDLITNHHWIVASLIKLQPGPDEDWQHDSKAMTAYLDRLSAFVSKLPPVQNPLKAQTLYHRLWLDRSLGKFDKERFLAYLQLPRPVGYLSKAMAESQVRKQFPADVSIDLRPGTLLPPIANDEPLVRSYLQHFLLDAANPKEFEPFINDIYLRHLFAETKILNGLGEPEQWAAQLPAELFQQLKQRVEIEFDPTNRTTYSAEDPVALDLHVKNVGTLIVKVFEINTKNFYREQLREVDTDVNLDGLVANRETTHTYNDTSFRRVRRRFELPELKKSGVYVVDFIGNGRSSRALIRKGKLKFLAKTGTAGQIFTVLDEKNQKVDDARILLSGHEYIADKSGEISVPFTHQPNRQPIVISRGEFACLDYFQHEGEAFALSAGIFVDRESLLSRKKATVVVRPQLTLNGTPVSTKLLEQVKLQIVSTDHDGVPSSSEIPNFKLFEDRESTHEFSVPPRVQSLGFRLIGQVKVLSTNQTIALAAQESFALNEIDRTDKIEDLHLLRTSSGYFVELLGKTGEPKTSRPVLVVLKHRDFRDPVTLSFKSDKFGRVTLGPLEDIVAITATGPQGTQHAWPIRPDEHVYSQSLHGRVGEVLTLPFVGWPPSANLRTALSLLELRGDSFLTDRFDNLSIKNGLITISGLKEGDYDLWLKSLNRHVRIRIVPGEAKHGYVLGSVRQLETKPLKALQIESVKADDKDLVIQLSNANKFARVHLFATRFAPAFPAGNHLAKITQAEPYAIRTSPAESVYLAGRNIGDEYRYIIDRKYAKKFPGNTLERPSLLLNPWVLRSTETGEQVAVGGDEFGAKGAPPPSEMARGEGQGAGRNAKPGDFANLDFLAEASAVFVNLVPDKDGKIVLKRDLLGAHQHLHIVACDPLSTTWRSVALDEPKSTFIDLRLANGLDPKKHFTQQKRISLVGAGQPFTLADIATSKFEAYDSLARVYLLFTTLTHDPKLAEFSFLLNWPKLKPEEQQEKYSKFACHELNVFLAKKDPKFFNAVVKPYLANKKDKTFLDRWLLDDKVDPFLQPWSHGQLNVAERVFLAQHINGEGPKTSRHIDELFKLQPPNIDRFLLLFDTAAKGSSLETDDGIGLKLNLGRQLKESEVMFEKLAADMPAPAPVAAGGGAPAAPQANRALGGLAGFGAMGGDQAEAKKAGKQQLGLREKAKEEAGVDRLRRGLARDGKPMDALAKRSGALADKKDSSANGVADLDADRTMAAEGHFFNAEMERTKVRQLYRKMDPTKEWAENNYYHLAIAEQNPALITVNSFWRDYAQHDPTKPFLSTNIADASRNFSEMMLALAVLDLPFEPAKHESKFDGPQMTLAAGSPMIVFHEEVKAAQPAADKVPILVSQNFFRHGDRHRQENGEQIDKYVADEFVIHTVYGCQVVVTNPTSARQKLTVLLQVPQGAIPVANGQPTKSVHVDLQPYHTQTLDYFFYFPAAGQFPHFPIHVAKNGELIAFATPSTFNVVDKPTKIDTESWDYVSQYASADDCLKFLNGHNVHGLNLDRMAWRMHDAKFFDAAISLLSTRHAFNMTLWSYGLKHNHVAATREFLQHSDGLVNECGGRLVSALLTIDPVARRTYEHLDYKPLVNARAHRLGQQRQIVNAKFNEQYHRSLREFSYQRSLTDDDLMVVTYDLLLQDRIEESLTTFARVNPERLPTRLQYDYFQAYLDFFTDNPKLARAIATKYTDYPVDRWRQAFASIKAQLDEIDGAGPKKIDTDDRNQDQTQLAATDPNFDFNVEAKQLTINHQNLDEVKVSYYLMDVELLFSRNPFVQQFRGQFSMIQPNRMDTVALVDRKQVAVLPNDGGTGSGSTAEPETPPKPEGTKATQGSKKVELPMDLHNKNVLVEITGGGQTKTQAYYSNSLTVQLIENYGQLKVTHSTTNKPIAKAYVKVYAQRPDGSSRFYKDGYTDLRGRFDYSSLNTNDLDAVAKFSVLVMSDEHGAIVKEANPPKQ
ncbi:hypothetical protein LBMAG52_05710 [Planctomycetia bacterium]|nr:hypothetical protein LBMAG52_05710 [Planctomycetia bacterium]